MTEKNLKNKPAEEKAVPKSKPANDTQKTAPKKVKPIVEYVIDKPHPFRVFKEEANRTKDVKSQSDQKRKLANEQLGGLLKTYKPTLEKFQNDLDKLGQEKLKVNLSTVEKLSKSAKETRVEIQALEEKLKIAKETLSTTNAELSVAEKQLKQEQALLTKENTIAVKGKKKALDAELTVAKKEKKYIYKKTSQEISVEKRTTLKRTIKETFNRFVSDLAAIPDVTVKLAKAKIAGIKEFASAFKRSFQKAGQVYDEPTSFSKTRRKPVAKTPSVQK